MRKFTFSSTAPREPESDQLHEKNPSAAPTELALVRAEQKGNRPTATHTWVICCLHQIPEYLVKRLPAGIPHSPFWGSTTEQVPLSHAGVPKHPSVERLAG